MRVGLLVVLFVLSSLFCFAEEAGQGTQPAPQIAVAKIEALPANEISQPVSDNVTLEFNDADILNVLKIISFKSGVNIVTTPEVIGNVTIRLVDVPWERALDVILKTYGFGYEKQGNIILVTKLENISKIQAEEALKTELFTLKFLDAQDAERALIPMLSLRGKISVLYAKGQKGWQFGTFRIGKGDTSIGQLQERAATEKSETVSIERTPEGRTISNKVEFESSVKSKALIISDTSSSLDRIRNFIKEIDRMPKQVLIETKIIEINTDKLRDIGFDWGTGGAGATQAYTTDPANLALSSKDSKFIAGRNLAAKVIPSIFSPKEGIDATTGIPGTYPYKAGLEVLFRKLTGTQFEVLLHALEEDVHTNTLSAPRILTLDNQEASILVGFHTPILTSTVTAGTSGTGTGATVTQTLDYYQEIGIRLNVVPQVSEEGYINMIVHPSVTSSSSNVTATSTASGVTTSTNYPIIDVREAQTQVMMKDGDTIVIGGLMKDVRSKEIQGIPFLSKIPYLGKLFTRETIDNGKIDLLIFITASVVNEDTFSPEKIAKLEERLERGEGNTVSVDLKKFPSKIIKAKP